MSHNNSRVSVERSSVADSDQQSTTQSVSMGTEGGGNSTLLRCDVLYDPEALLTPIQPFQIHIHNQDNVLLAYKVSMKHPERYIVCAGDSAGPGVQPSSSSLTSNPAKGATATAAAPTGSGHKGIVLKGGNKVVTIFLKPPMDPSEAEKQSGAATAAAGNEANQVDSSRQSQNITAYFVPPANPPTSDVFQVEIRAVFAESLRDDGSPDAISGGRSPTPRKDEEQQMQLVSALMSRFGKMWDHSIAISAHKVPTSLQFISAGAYVKHLQDMTAQRVGRLSVEKNTLTKQLEDLTTKTAATIQRNVEFEKEILILEVEAMHKCGVLSGGKVHWFWGLSGVVAAFLLPLVVA